MTMFNNKMVTTPQMENHTNLEWRDHTDSTLSQPKREYPNRSEPFQRTGDFVDFSIQTSIFGGFPPCVSHILGVPLKPVKMQPHGTASARSDQLLTSHTAAAMESKDGSAPSTTK